MKTRFSGLLRSLGMVALAGVIGLAGAGRALAQDKVTVAGWSQPISEITNLLAEPDKGFFKAKGIALDYVPGNGGGAAIQNMLTGQADVAFTDPASFFLALDKGQKLVAIYNIYPQNVFNVVSPKERNITKPADLKGKKIGVYSLSSGTYQNLQVLLHQVGLSEKDVTIEVAGLLNFAPVIQGQVDATAATDTGLYVGLQKGLKDVNVIEVKDTLNLPSDIFVVTEDTYRTKKDVLKRFLAAYRDSAAWMIAQPEEAARIAVTRAINGRDEATNLAIIKLRNASSQSDTTKAKGLGVFEPELMQKGADTFKQLGLITKDLDMSKLVVTDLIPQ
ncbi:ABC transporter substrate-binding protein [Azospirillum rugosum]|uniref:NitT/TauT family transport system substrate-binding protein n=1 Tax=Azospirillum rugosum TaxID=416170 RepID=A0ABS4SJY4_9PROT|nr:ABC transporter substrate-binding protein [Azospirillum rugosum]MBP2292873.1 NitT/TauT family transport system substrate-binding protein [Azospirillum rugosum]MDQ0529375.1 NitT/TauT family transport system substrate-binding protein [Azospirillum rugosum]